METGTENPSSESTSGGSKKLLKIREDLQPFFEVCSQAESTVTCKLWKTGKCKFDGVNGTLKFNSDRGWFPFERHLVRVHKFSYDKLANGTTSEDFLNGNEETNINPTIAGPESSKKKRIRGPRRGRQARKAKCCVVCREFCISTNNVDSNMSVWDLNSIPDGTTREFPGSEGCFQLNQQLFPIYFLRHINDFPASKCAKYLKQCQGARMPETWFYLCYGCKNLVSKAAALEEQILSLQKKVRKIRKLVRDKTEESVNTNADAMISDVAMEVRKHILDAEIPNVKQEIVESLLEEEEEPSHENDDWNNPFHDDKYDLDWNPSKKKNHTVTTDTSRKRSRSSRPSRSPKKKKVVPVDVDSEVDDNSQLLLNDDNDDTNESTPSLRVRRNIFINENDNDETDARLDDIEHCIKIDTDFDPRQPSTECLSGDDFSLEPSALGFDNDDSEYPVPSPAEMRVADDDCDYVEEAEPEEDMGVSGASSDGSDYAPRRRKRTPKKRSRPKKPSTSTSNTSVQPKQSVKQTPTISKPKGTPNDVEGEQEHVCDICQAKYKNRKRFRDHQVAHEISKALGSRFECPQCGYPCTSERARNIHISYRHTKNHFKCSLCSFVALRKRQLTNHIKEHRMECQKDRVGDKYLCSMCNRLFPTYRHLCKHKRALHFEEIGIEPLKCEYCTDTFSTSQHLKDHIQQTHQKDSKYYCEICGRGTLYMSKLIRHMKSHQKDDRCYICQVCGADFLYNETMKAHMKKEHPETLLENQSGGETKLENKSSTSTLYVTFKCKHCELQLPSQSCLARHIKTHDELFANKCDFCGKGYATAQSLRRHKEINHTKNQVPCPYCEKLFPHKEYIRAHYKFCKLYPGRQELPGEPLPESEAIARPGQFSQTLNMKIESEAVQDTSEQLESESSGSVEPDLSSAVVITPTTVTETNIGLHESHNFVMEQTDLESICCANTKCSRDYTDDALSSSCQFGCISTHDAIREQGFL